MYHSAYIFSPLTLDLVAKLSYNCYQRMFFMNVLNIVMVEPEIPQNMGNVARTCAATGAKLHIIKPMGFEIDDKKLKRAGLDYWHFLDITYYENLSDFFSKNNGACYYFSTKAQNIYSNVSYPNNCYLFFGKEHEIA